MTFVVVSLGLYIFVALFFLVSMIRNVRRISRQRLWPRVSAEVTQHRIRQQKLNLFREFRVRYAFEGIDHHRWAGVADGTHHSSVGPKGSTTSAREALEHLMSKHPVGSQLEIMINPADHDEVYFVERELPALAITIVTAAIFTALFAVFLYIAAEYLGRWN